ncbi:MAG: MATE family efflux transporter [Myxococcales bacterium]|nr:MATE family efflux transporter [Myxococcales bacterium]
MASAKPNQKRDMIGRLPTGGYREVVNVAWPIVLSMLSYTFMGVADTLLVGQLGAREVAAVGLGTVAMFAVISFGWGMLDAVKVVVAQAHGAGDETRTISATMQGIALSVASGALILLILPLGPPLLRALGGSGEATRLARDYFVPRLFGALPMLASIAAFGYFQGHGDTRTPMRLQIAANLLNVALDLVLIFGLGPIPALGVAGAAWATVIALTLQAVAALALFFRATTGRRKFEWSGVRRLIDVGLPMGLRFFLDVLSWALFTGFIARYSEAHLAAHTIVVRVISVSFLPGRGIGDAGSILVGHAVGAGRFDRARIVVRRATIVAATLMGGFGVLFLSAGGAVVGLFTRAPEVIELGRKLMLIAAAFQVVDAIVMVKSGALNGEGDTRFVMLSSALSSWLLLLPLGYLFCAHWRMGAHGAWLALTAQIVVLAAVSAWRWERRRADEAQAIEARARRPLLKRKRASQAAS